MQAADLALEALKHDEGFRARPYRDTVGKLTVGYGRNLDDKGLTEQEAAFLLQNDVVVVEAELLRLLPVYSTLFATQQAVLLNMAVNMGVPRLLGFKKMLTALARRDFAAAAAEMLDSKWAAQVGARAQRLAKEMRDGIVG